MNKPCNILICPLEWGLGHAARMIPLARRLKEMNYKVFIASGEEHLSMFRSELPGLSYVTFTGFKPGYSRYFPQYLSLLFKIPILLYHIIREHQMVKKIIEKHEIDIIISDNRFGLWNSKIISVYVTHMPRIPFPKPFGFLEFAGTFLHRQIIKRYTLCFIPDLPAELNLSGRLSHGILLPDNVRFIGILSKFFGHDQTSKIPDNSRHNTVILSGPEPQKEILKQKLITLLRDDSTSTIMIEGKPLSDEKSKNEGNITFYSHLASPEMKSIIQSSLRVITRSGYTTIMELVSLNCSALLIPTPGQTEQEYLAEYLSEKGWFNALNQKKIGTMPEFRETKVTMHTEIMKESSLLLTKALEELSDKHHKHSEPYKTCE